MDYLDKKISDLLRSSSIPSILKNFLKSSMELFSSDQKRKIFETLVVENKKLTGLNSKEKRIIQKYQITSSKIPKI